MILRPAFIAALAALLTACGGASQSTELPQVDAPTSGAASAPQVRIPEGVLPLPPEPPADPEVRRTIQEGRDLVPQINPCGGAAPGAVGRVANRQLIVTTTRGIWKSQRVVVYETADAAAAAVAAIRADLAKCATRSNADGTSVRWTAEPLAVRDEAFHVGGQYHRGDAVLRGHFRGVLARRGRVLAIAFDFNRMLDAPTVAETAEQEQWAAAVVDQLDDAPWLSAM